MAGLGIATKIAMPTASRFGIGVKKATPRASLQFQHQTINYLAKIFFNCT